ncbi:protocatechuate 3,4-dioxygenase [Anaplasma marginale]|nr:protocatechuate 3,4-dioxygenase [Anaplasma marginale]
MGLVMREVRKLNKWFGGVFAGLAALLVCFSRGAGAVDPVIVNCVETPEIHDVSEMPNVFNLSNNLARKPGSPVVADGELVYIVGRVTDSKCHPLSNVSVFMWQADSRGVYNSGRVASSGEAAGSLGKPGEVKYDEHFNGSGKATTDNLGNFGFVTIMPGRHMGRSPRLHFLLKHQDFPELQTEMFFEGLGGSEDPGFSRIPASMRKLLTARLVDEGGETGVKVYEFNMTFAENFGPAQQNGNDINAAP